MKIVDKETIIERIVRDPSIAKSEASKKLLMYLAECSTKHYVPNETDIAQHALGKGPDFDPSYDASVRVHISKLRKKLEYYYKTRGKHDKIRIDIPKRQYSLELYEKSTRKNKIDKFVKIALPTAVFVLSVAVVVLLIQNHSMRKKIPPATVAELNSFIWKDFVDNEKSALMVVGHVFAYCEYQDEYNSFRIVRNRLINSKDDLSKYMALYNIPTEHIWMPSWEIIPKYALYHFSLIESIFSRASRPLAVKLSSNLAWPDFQDNHIIYVGHFHNLAKLTRFYQSDHFYSPSQNTDYMSLIAQLDKNWAAQQYLSTNNIQASLENQLDALFVVYHYQSDSDSSRDVYKYAYDEETKYVRDYAILMKLPGPHQSQLLFIVSFHQIGRLTVIKMLTNPNRLEHFEKQIQERVSFLPQYFEILIEVKGYEETSMEMDIVHIYPVDSEFMLINQ